MLFRRWRSCSQYSEILWECTWRIPRRIFYIRERMWENPIHQVERVIDFIKYGATHCILSSSARFNDTRHDRKYELRAYCDSYVNEWKYFVSVIEALPEVALPKCSPKRVKRYTCAFVNIVSKECILGWCQLQSSGLIICGYHFHRVIRLV